MAAETILVRFLLYLCILFFIPKLFQRWLPAPITEVLLGVGAALFASSFVSVDAFVPVLAALGIITLFVYAGLETNVAFIQTHKGFFIENSVLFLLLFGIVGFVVHAVTDFSWQMALLFGLALTVPSASFILSSVRHNPPTERRWIEAKALAGEITGLIALALLLGAGNWQKIAITFIVVIALITLVPFILRFVYKQAHSVLRGAEFPFVLVVAFLAAFITDTIGLHFLVGAFVAGIVARRFLYEVSHEDRTTLSQKNADAVVHSFGSFAATFAPFFFFSAGYKVTHDALSWIGVVFALGLVIVVSALRVSTVAVHRHFRVSESWSQSWRIGVSLLPTLVITFVIADILRETYTISLIAYGVLMLYAVVLTFVPTLALAFFSRERKRF